MLSVRKPRTGDLVVVPVLVVELSFDSAPQALQVASRIISGNPDSVTKVLTESDLKSGSSILHIHVLAREIDEFLRRNIRAKDGGVMMIAEPDTN